MMSFKEVLTHNEHVPLEKNINFLVSRCKKSRVIETYRSKQLKNTYSYPQIKERVLKHCFKYSKKCNSILDPKPIIMLYCKGHKRDMIKKKHSYFQTDYHVYRCQYSSKDDSCCCSCNSDAMFEVMKGLYDCYKKKNCDNCKCILCCHIPLEMREKGVVTLSDTDKKEKIKNAIAEMVGKTPEEKENILRDLAMANIALPEPKTPSEVNILKKVRKALGLTPEPETATEKAKLKKAENAGIGMIPLEGKTPDQKLKILKDMFDMGLPLPEGRTPSEIELINKVKGGEPPEPAKLPQETGKIAPDVTQKPVLQEKTPSEKALATKTKIKSLKPALPSQKTRLEGKAPIEKEKGIPLTEGGTPSEKTLKTKAKGTVSVRKPSSKVQKVKTPSLITPLAGKTPEQKVNILKGLAMAGLPLPEPKTPSESKLIDKVRAELGLPAGPKTPSMKEKYKKAADEGALVPLEGKSPAEKEKILQNLMDRGIPLPEGRTPSEKNMISKLLNPKGLPSEKLRKSKGLGVISPLAGKTLEHKENMLKGLAMTGQPLPEGKTPSEIKLNNKVRTDLGLPPEPKSPSLREKYDKAAKDGLLVPLEGKTPAEKQKHLQNLADRGIPLPEGRTPSEKNMIAKIKPKPRLSSENLRKAKAAGIATTLTGKTPEEKEKMLKRYAMEGRPFPEAKTPSEKNIIDRIRTEMNLPAETKSIKSKTHGGPALSPDERKFLDDKTAKVMKEGKGPADECICEILSPAETPVASKSFRRKTRGILTVTPEERKILDDKTAKVMKEGKGPADECICGLLTPPSDVPLPKSLGRRLSDKIADAKAAGVMTPLEGKTPEQKEKILKGLAKRGLPLPESKTPSEKQLMDKVRKQFGLPPEPQTPSLKQKYAQAQALGLLTPLEGKTATQKEKVLTGLADKGIPLPEGRTPSEKAMIAAIAGRPKSVTPATEKLRKARAAGLVTPLTGKTPAQKDKILRDLVAAGLPLPDARSPSDAEVIKKVKADTGYVTPTSSEKLRKAQAAGLLTPLAGKTPSTIGKLVKARLSVGLPLPEETTPSEKSIINRERMKYAKAAGLLTPLKGKTPEQKENILRALAKTGLPLPAAKTPSEVALVNKIKNEISSKSQSKAKKTPSEKLRQAKAAGFLTPLTGKSPEQKEKIIRGLAKSGLPLPEGKTLSEKNFINKIRNELGLPPNARSLSIKEKMRQAYDAGLVATLEGKSQKEKENIINNYIQLGIPLPEGYTPSDKALILKIKAMALSKIPLQKESKAKPSRLIISLEGKSQAEKEKILRDLIIAGLPLPEGKTVSEKALINKIKTESGKPLPAITEKEVVGKTKADGILTPLAGKSKKEKEKILRGLAEAGLPLPTGSTLSEKSLVKKVRAETGLRSEPTPSENRGKIKIKTRKEVIKKKKIKAEGDEQSEEIVKTTKCDRACGCDKKKIKFKHSYVKIKVTSPDLSSICPCPDECFPPIKTGIVTDYEGIKVTVGRAIGIPSYSSYKTHTSKSKLINTSAKEIVSTERFSDGKISVSSKSNFPEDKAKRIGNLDENSVKRYYSEVFGLKDQMNYIMKYRRGSVSADITTGSRHSHYMEDLDTVIDFSSNAEKIESFDESDSSIDNSSETISCSTPISISLISRFSDSYTSSSSQSLFIVQTESSLCLYPDRTLSVMSFKYSTFLNGEDSSPDCSCYICNATNRDISHLITRT